jgi:hypothetical protein
MYTGFGMPLWQWIGKAFGKNKSFSPEVVCLFTACSAETKYLMKTKSLLLALTVSFALTCAVSSNAQDATKKVLKNADVVKLKTLGFGDDLIIQKIKSSKCEFDTELDGLTALKQASISEKVISAMMEAGSGGSEQTAAVKVADPNNPSSPHESGIWLYEEREGKPHMTQLEPSVYSQSQSGNLFVLQFGGTTKTKAVLSGAHANIETTNHRPVFYFYFDKTQSGLSDNRAIATSPNQYILANFEVNEKDNQRTVATGQMNAFSGTKQGTDAEALRSFRNEKLAPGIYKVWLDHDLKNSEYGFYFAANTHGGNVFDFRINGSPDAATQSQVADTKPEPTDGKKHPFKNLFHKTSANANSEQNPASPKTSN